MLLQLNVTQLHRRDATQRTAAKPHLLLHYTHPPTTIWLITERFLLTTVAEIEIDNLYRIWIT